MFNYRMSLVILADMHCYCISTYMITNLARHLPLIHAEFNLQHPTTANTWRLQFGFGTSESDSHDGVYSWPDLWIRIKLCWRIMLSTAVQEETTGAIIDAAKRREEKISCYKAKEVYYGEVWRKQQFAWIRQLFIDSRSLCRNSSIWFSSTI